MLSVRTSQSARSVAVENPEAAEARIRSTFGVMVEIMPVIACSDRSSASNASKVVALSSCMSFE